MHMENPAVSFAPAHVTDGAFRSVADAARAGVIMRTADETQESGRRIRLGGTALLNFGACSYLGLDRRPELAKGAIDAIRRYGTQFPFPRAHVQCSLYEELESALGVMTDGHVLVAASTTLGHIAALPVLMQPGDAVVIDQFAHASIHTAAALLRSCPIEHVRHNRIDLLEKKIARLARSHKRVWYLADGLYSMLGDFMPLQRITPLLDKYPQLRLYIDDAHSTSWLGRSGRGHALDVLADRSRVVVALSLNKAFAAGGAALVFFSDEERDRVRHCGGPMLFSGAVQPPLLGAALASAELHLASDFNLLQRSLLERIHLVNSLAREQGIPLASEDVSPIFFVKCGAPDVTFTLVRALESRGLYTSVAVFPAVPQNQSGIRFTVSLHNTMDDVRALMSALATETARFGLQRESGTFERESA
jgi:7-keto-8-aminopelargonate synthetase-like enzyme